MVNLSFLECLKYFLTYLLEFQDHDIHRYFREACMTLGEAAVESGDFEHALHLFNRVETSHAAWNEAQVTPA